MIAAPTFQDIFAVMSAASVGDMTARVALAPSPDVEHESTKLALALNILLDDLAIGFADVQRELGERSRIAHRLQVLTDASRAFSEATGDLDELLAVVARHLGEVVGDMCAVRSVTADGQWIEAEGAAYHRDPELLAATREVMLSGRQRVGEGISGRVVASKRPVLTRHVQTADLLASSEPRYRPFLARLAVTSAMTLPLMCRGEAVGVANLLRSRPGEPYDEDDLHFLQSIAEHAALALSNARSYAAERRARDAAEKATLAVRAAETRFTRLLECGLLGVLVSDLGGHVTEINDVLLALVGYSRDEIVSGNVVWLDLTRPDTRAVDARAIEQLRDVGVAQLRQKWLVRSDGTSVPVLVGSAMLDAETAISFFLDLTELEAARSALETLRGEHAAEAKFRGLLEAAPDAMVMVGDDGKIELVNARLETLFGYARAEIVGHSIDILVPERFRQGHRSARAAYLLDVAARATGSAIELCGRRKDGTELPIEVSLSPMQTHEGLLVSAAIRDITDRKNAEQQTARLAAIVESSDEAIIGKTLEGVVTSWNQGAQRIFGYAADEMVGKPVALLVPPERADEEPMILETVARGEIKRFDTVRLRKGGAYVDVAVTISPVRDAEGKIVGISKVARDVTDRRRAELELSRAKEAVDAANRELEAFSYSVAHDLRAPLRRMNGFAQALRDSSAASLDPTTQDWVDEIALNATKMGDLIDALLALARVTSGGLSLERVDLSEIVREVASQLVALESPRTTELVVEAGVFADVDGRLVRALFENLLGNAWKFTRNVTAPRIEFGSREAGGDTTFFVRDNGAGFDMEFANRLFAPFQRLHSTHEFPGTGIGLATVQRIVQRHGGRVWAEAAVDRGATFQFTLGAVTPGAAS